MGGPRTRFRRSAAPCSGICDWHSAAGARRRRVEQAFVGSAPERCVAGWLADDASVGVNDRRGGDLQHPVRVSSSPVSKPAGFGEGACLRKVACLPEITAAGHVARLDEVRCLRITGLCLSMGPLRRHGRLAAAPPPPSGGRVQGNQHQQQGEQPAGYLTGPKQL